MPHPTPSLPMFLLTSTPPTDIHTLSLHDALPILLGMERIEQAASKRHACDTRPARSDVGNDRQQAGPRSEEHTSELQSLRHLVCRLLLEKKKNSKKQ